MLSLNRINFVRGFLSKGNEFATILGAPLTAALQIKQEGLARDTLTDVTCGAYKCRVDAGYRELGT